MDSLSENVIYHQVVRTEKDVYYQKAMNRLREKGYKIQSITCDGRRGILNDFLNTPTQMCHFHMVAIVIRKLTRKPKSAAGKALKILVKTLKHSTRNAFYKALHLCNGSVFCNKIKLYLLNYLLSILFLPLKHHRGKII